MAGTDGARNPQHPTKDAMDALCLSLLSLIPTVALSGPFSGSQPVSDSAPAPIVQEASALDWAGNWTGRMEAKPGLPLPPEGVPFGLVFRLGDSGWEGSLEVAGQKTPLTKLEVTEAEIEGDVSLMGFAGSFRFEPDGDSIRGEFKTVFTVEATADRVDADRVDAEPKRSVQLDQSEELFERLWRGTALAVPYADDLTLEEKVAGLSLLWSEVKFNFAYFDQVPELDWDAEYLAALTRVMDSWSTASYYDVLRKLVAKLGDGHTNVYLPSELMDRYMAVPPISTLPVEGVVIVTEVSDPDLAAKGVSAGLELVSIDGTPTAEYASKHVAPYICSSTPQDKDRQVHGPALLRGKLDSEVKVVLKDAEGTEREHTLRRGPRRWKSRASVEFEELDDGLGYLAIHSFQGDSLEGQVEAAMEALADTRGLIIDLRENSGGNSGWWVMEHLVEEYQTSAWATRQYLPAKRAWGRPEAWYRGDPAVYPGRSKLYEAPVVLLTSPLTASAAEDLASVFKHSGRGTIIGDRTCGSTGQPLFFSLPGGGSARVCTKRDTYADGTEWVGFGVEPDILLRPTVADYRDEQDSVLQAARDHLR